MLQPRGSDLVSPLRWPLDTCVLCLPIPLPAPGWGRHRDSLRWEAVLPARALRPWAGPCPRSAFLGGQICTGAFLHCLPVTREGPGSSDKRTLAAPSRCERCLPRVMLAFAPRSSQVPAAHSAKLRALTTVLTATGGGADGKACACNVGDPGSIPGSGRSPGEGNGNPLQCSCLENPRDGGAWWDAVYGVAQSRTRLSNFTFHFFFSHPLTFSSFQTWEGEQGPRFTDEQVESQSSLVISEPVPGCPCFLQQDASRAAEGLCRFAGGLM